MKYSELIAELNKKYDTDVFYEFYEGFDTEIENYATQTAVHFKSQIGEEFTTDIDLKTLEIKNIYTYKSIDIKTIEAIAKGSQTDKVKELEKKVNELEVSAGLQVQTIESQRAALNYAQSEVNKMEKLARIIKNLKAPKNQYNSFGKYHYRNCEDILEAVKPLLDGAILTITDDIVQIGDRFYVRATATFRDGDFVQSVCGWAREELDKKSMDASQITGSASSYARKYALNGLFCIDDTKDADSKNNTGKEAKEKQLGICDAVAEKEAKEKVDPVVYYTGLVAKAGITGDEADILVHEFEKKMNSEQRKEECRRLLAIIKGDK